MLLQCNLEHTGGIPFCLPYPGLYGRSESFCVHKQRGGMRPARGRVNGLSFSNVDSFLVHTAPCVRVEVRTAMLRILGARAAQLRVPLGLLLKGPEARRRTKVFLYSACRRSGELPVAASPVFTRILFLRAINRPGRTCRRSYGFEEASAYGCQVPLSFGSGQVRGAFASCCWSLAAGALRTCTCVPWHMRRAALTAMLCADMQVSQVYTPSLSAIRLFASDAQGSR